MVSVPVAVAMTGGVAVDVTMGRVAVGGTVFGESVGGTLVFAQAGSATPKDNAITACRQPRRCVRVELLRSLCLFIAGQLYITAYNLKISMGGSL